MKIREYIKSFTDRELAEGYAYLYGDIKDIRSNSLHVDEAEEEIAMIKKAAEADDSGIWEWYLNKETEKTCSDISGLSEEANAVMKKQEARYATALLVQFYRISRNALLKTNKDAKKGNENVENLCFLPCIVY